MMVTETSDKAELSTAIGEVVSLLLRLVLTLDENKINAIPYANSWTAGELLRHITKSTKAIAEAMKRTGKPVQRDPGEKISLLKKTFLDFSHKMNSPEFIIPEKVHYEKQTSIKELKQAFDDLLKNSNDAKLNEVVEDLPMGEVTKLEILHFVLYHTQRHLHQLEKISAVLESS